jgi:integrase
VSRDVPSLIEQRAGFGIKKTPRLSTHIADYLKFAAEDHPATAETKDRRVLDAFLAAVGDKRLDQLSPFDGERWRTQRAQVVSRGKRRLSRATINRELNVVLGCVSKAVEWKRLARSPFAELKPWNTDEIPIRTLSAEQRAIILQRFPRELALICRVTLEALLRLSEVLGLTRDDLKPEGLQRRLKGGTVKTISVTPTLLADLRACLRTPTQIHVFGDPPPGQAVISVRFTRAFRAFGLHGVSHHTMRHTGVTDMLEDGVSPRAIQELAGWTSLRMLERYGHVRDAEMQRAVAGTAARNAAALAHAIAVPVAVDGVTTETIRPQKRPHAKTRSS